jgi:hypothetical protein
MDLHAKEIGSMDWIEPAHDRDRWRTLVPFPIWYNGMLIIYNVNREQSFNSVTTNTSATEVRYVLFH